MNSLLRGLLYCSMLFTLLVNFMAAQDKTFKNPILAGFYPDPSICRVDSNYYLINSTFAYFPGIPIFHSKDLVNWKLMGHVLDRPEQLKLDGLGVSRGIFAPSIRFHKGIYYVTCTLVDGGGNFVVTSDKPEGPWSNPVWLPQVNGIDPCLYFDDDGKTYLLYNSDAPDNKPLYEGHRTIRIVEFDITYLRITGDNKILINGGVDLSKKPIWIEGPHIYKKDSIYYLTCAEGGTAEDHSQVIFRSKNVDGPFIPYERNPILTQRYLDPKRNYPVTCSGHADFVETLDGDWWTIFLGCKPYRPFEENYYNTGRETFLAPIEWKEGWPLINSGFERVQYRYPLPVKTPTKRVDIPYNDNYTLTDNFELPELHPGWFFLRTPKTKWYSQEDSYLILQLRPEKVSDPVNPSFIARRQQHSTGHGMVSLDFTPKAENEKAGLLIFQDETHFYFVCKSLEGTSEVIQLYQSTSDSTSDNIKLIISQKLDKELINKEILLKIETRGKEFKFYYGSDKNNWKVLKDKIDATFLSIRNAWGFVGNVYAIYATSLGKQSNNTAAYDWFEYKGDDEVFKKEFEDFQ